jgi:hypothetical protein
MILIWTTLIMCISSMRPQNCNRKLFNNIASTKRERSIIGEANFKLISSSIKSTKSLHDSSSSTNLNRLCPLKGAVKSDDIKRLNIELSDIITSNMINGYDMRNIVDKNYLREYYEKIYKIKSLLKNKPLEEHNRNKISSINIKIKNDFDVEII